MQISQITPILNDYKYSKSNIIKKQNNVNFGCAESEVKSSLFTPFKKQMKSAFRPIMKPFEYILDKLTDSIAKVQGKILKNESFKKFVKSTDKNDLVKHITCLTSIILSGFYVKQTLQNDQLDKTKRTTLAINQTAVTIFSAIASYTLDGFISKPVNKFIDRFIAVNATNKKIGKYVDGIKCAQSMIIFGTIYRFIAPVVMTPIANHIGNKLEERNEAKLKQQA